MVFNRDMLADTFAMITFGIVVGMSVELLAGLSFEQSLQSRLMSVPVNLLTARAYGLYRDWLIRRGRFIGNGFMQMTLLDALAFLSFQIPLYALLLLSTGVNLEQLLVACAGQIGAMLIMGRPYGIYLQLCRNWFKPVTIPAV
ncbi:L-alanine exporter AlaE [Endozoicomonas acroporae]|uniref:L-alanine exporter AlaE n=1 Tax=Endozoicomonas TaxID=305899 RepID=UPI0013D2E049|nr:L-alanine exporter AlaE [Endozoicomonas acroporae]